MGPPSSPYRDGRAALRSRHADLRMRLQELDLLLSARQRPLPPVLKERIENARRAAEPASQSARAVLGAEHAVAALEAQMDEVLGLAAALNQSINPILPAGNVIARWTLRVLLSCALIGCVIVELGWGDFMLSAMGVKVLRAETLLPCERLAFEALHATGGSAPEHAQWVDPAP